MLTLLLVLACLACLGHADKLPGRERFREAAQAKLKGIAAAAPDVRGTRFEKRKFKRAPKRHQRSELQLRADKPGREIVRDGKPGPDTGRWREKRVARRGEAPKGMKVNIPELVKRDLEASRLARLEKKKRAAEEHASQQ